MAKLKKTMGTGQGPDYPGTKPKKGVHVDFLPRLVNAEVERIVRERVEKAREEEIAAPVELDDILESICGGVDDSQNVESYDGNLGVTRVFVDAHEQPVGDIQWNGNLGTIYTNPGNVAGVRWCSGTLITNNLFLTAGHCFDQTGGGWTRPRINGTNTIIPPAEIATNMHVDFNYQLSPAGALRPITSYDIVELMEYRLGGLDYAIARLEDNPGATFSTTPVSGHDGNVGDMLCIIGHPNGIPKVIEAGPLTRFSDNYLDYESIDTDGGSSGSGILGPSGNIIGVHTNGGCDSVADGHNHGVRISPIVAVSPILSNMLFPLCS